MPISGEQAERWGLVNHAVEEGKVLKKAREAAEAIIKNNQDMVLKYKAVINDGLKLDLAHALSLERVVFQNFLHTYIHISFSQLRDFPGFL
jgi:enoyl-CoA hydratase/carnithine racemase